MKSLLSVILFAAAAGCESGARGRGTTAVLPDTQTIDGVLQMRHDADAFARAPQWVIDTAVAVALVPTARVSSSVSEEPVALRLPDGAWAMIGRFSGRVVMFDATGGDPREYWPGELPGGNFGRSSLLAALHDTVVVIDGESRALYRYTYAGMVRVDSFPGQENCLHTIGQLPDRRLLARLQCAGQPDLQQPAPRGRLPVTLVTMRDDFGDVRPFATLPGVELNARPAKSTRLVVNLGHRLHHVVWNGAIVTATGENGYSLDVRTPEGAITRRIVVDQARRGVTDEMRAAVKKEWGEGIVADTIGPFERVVVGADGLLWVIDAVAPTDSLWTATAFRTDGAIVGRLTASHPLPTWFGAGQVMQTGSRALQQYIRREFHVKAIVPRMAR